METKANPDNIDYKVRFIKHYFCMEEWSKLSAQEKNININLHQMGSDALQLLSREEIKTKIMDDESKVALNFVIMGSSGVGKSSTLNNLIEDITVDGVPKRAEVGTKGQSMTKDIIKYCGKLLGRQCNLFDTPGFQDSHGLKDELIMSMIMQKICCETESKQIDGFILVDSMQADRIYSKLYIDRIKKVFGNDALRKIVVLTTKGENELLSRAKKSREGFHAKKREITGMIAELGVKNQPITWSNDFELGPAIWNLEEDDMIDDEEMKKTYLKIQRFIVKCVLDDLGGPISSDQLTQLQNVFIDFEASVREQIGIRETFIEMTGPKCMTKWHEPYEYQKYDPNVGSIMGSIFSLGISAACGANHTTVKVEGWTEYFDTSSPMSVSVPLFGNQTMKNIRYEKLGGDGYLKSHEVDYSKASITAELTTTGDKPVRYRFYAIVQSLPPDIDMKLRILSRDCIAQVIVKQDGQHYEYRNANEIYIAAQKYLETKHGSDLDQLIAQVKMA